MEASTMYHDDKVTPMRLVSGNGAPSPVVSRWIPPPLERRARANPAAAYERGLAELSVDLIIMSRRAKQILDGLNQSGSMHEQFLHHLTALLERELTELLAIAQQLQSR